MRVAIFPQIFKLSTIYHVNLKRFCDVFHSESHARVIIVGSKLIQNTADIFRISKNLKTIMILNPPSEVNLASLLTNNHRIHDEFMNINMKSLHSKLAGKVYLSMIF